MYALRSSLILLFLLGPALVPASTQAQEGLWGGALVSKIDSLAAATLEAGPVASLAIGVKRGDDLLLTRGYGYADLENGVRAGAETVYRIGSVTKQFTAAAVMQLVEAGKIDLDARINDYLRDYPTQGHEVTIRHLLTHTSGIKSYTGLAAWRPKMPLDLTDSALVALFKDEPFDFAPGEQWLYNNSGFYLLGMIIEEASGETYREYLQSHLFGPLGLTGSFYCDERPLIRGRAEGYEQADGELVNDAPLSMNQPGGAGALCSTVPDLLSWTKALRSGRVVSRESYGQMSTEAALNDDSGTGYGFGLGIGELSGHEMISHGGGINGFVTMLSHYPETDLDVVVLSNTGGPQAGQVARTISLWALGVPVQAVQDLPLEEDQLAVYVGTFELAPGFLLTVYSEDGQLWTRATGQDAFRLRAQGDHVFIPTFDDSVRIEFEVEDGSATVAVLHQGGQVTRAERVSSTP